MLYSKSAPTGEVKVMVAEGIKQLGCVIAPTTAAGFTGKAFTKLAVGEEIQPVEISRTVIENVVFGVKLAKVVLDW
jgi:hypothetical protein